MEPAIAPAAVGRRVGGGHRGVAERSRFDAAGERGEPARDRAVAERFGGQRRGRERGVGEELGEEPAVAGLVGHGLGGEEERG